jgi:SpoVK/Ycf46/Vps4 family AAA+-type ATPase
VLLTGPPGNGKTTLAEAIAAALVVPIIVPRYESIVGSYLGETSQRLRQLFDYAALRRCVLFFDEFDTVGKERADEHETGEIKRVVSSLLMQIDQLPSHVVVMCATNHPELLDRAVWRRFELRAELGRPTAAQIQEWFRRFARRFNAAAAIELLDVAKIFRGANFSDLEQFGMKVLRRVILESPGADFIAIASREVPSQPQSRSQGTVLRRKRAVTKKSGASRR